MSQTRNNANGRAFEWWMVSFIAAGAGWAAFISLLIPPYVTESTGNAADAGIVMAIISLAAVLAPVLGGFADKYRAHRLVLSLGVLGMALGFLMYSISAEVHSHLCFGRHCPGRFCCCHQRRGTSFRAGREPSSEVGSEPADGFESTATGRPGHRRRSAGCGCICQLGFQRPLLDRRRVHARLAVCSPGSRLPIRPSALCCTRTNRTNTTRNRNNHPV